jgi:hypothetical protein
MVFVRSLLAFSLPNQLYDTFLTSSSRIRLLCSRQHSFCSACECGLNVVKVRVFDHLTTLASPFGKGNGYPVPSRSLLGSPTSLAIFAVSFYSRNSSLSEANPDIIRADMTWVLFSQTQSHAFTDSFA